MKYLFCLLLISCITKEPDCPETCFERVTENCFQFYNSDFKICGYRSYTDCFDDNISLVGQGTCEVNTYRKECSYYGP